MPFHARRVLDDGLTRSNGAQKPYLVHGLVQRCARRNHGSAIVGELRAYGTPLGRRPGAICCSGCPRAPDATRCGNKARLSQGIDNRSHVSGEWIASGWPTIRNLAQTIVRDVSKVPAQAGRGSRWRAYAVTDATLVSARADRLSGRKSSKRVQCGEPAPSLTNYSPSFC